MYEYQATLVRVVDGDTLNLDVDLGLDVHIKTAVRLLGVNTPEMNTAEGKTAKEYVLQWFTLHAPSVFTIQTVKREKYGRYLADIIAPDGHNLNQDLLIDGQAVAYLP